MNELDEILLEQLHNTKKNKKMLKRARKLYINDPVIDIGEVYIDGRIKFFENMISDKSLLLKKYKRKKKTKDPDILAKSPSYELYRQAIYVTIFGYKMFMDSVSQYMSYFKKGKI